MNYAQPYASAPHLSIEAGEEKKEEFCGGGTSFQITNQTSAGFSVNVTSYVGGNVLGWKREAQGACKASHIETPQYAYMRIESSPLNTEHVVAFKLT